MTPNLHVEFDLSGLNAKMGELLGAIIGMGNSGAGDIHRFTRTEAGHLAWDISAAVGPRDTQSAAAGVDRTLMYVFRSGKTSNLTEKQHYSSTADFTWLYSFKRNGGGVLGLNDEDDQRQISGVKELETMLRAGLAHKRGNAYEDLGKRGKMHIVRLNRILISQSAWRGMAKKIMDTTGQLRASFAYTAVKLGLKKNIPAFVRRHIESGAANGKAIFDDALLNHPTHPSIEFGSCAPGVLSNPYVVSKIEKAVANRKEKLVKKMQQVLRGYTYNWNTGQVYQQVPEGGIPD